MNKNCISCGIEITNKDCFALNRKLLGRKINVFYCMDCLADYFGVTVDELLEKIEEFKEHGCKLF